MLHGLRLSSGSVGAVCEGLERRELFSLSLSDYYPLGTGDTWAYSGVLREGGVRTTVTASHTNVPAPDGSIIENFSITGGDVSSQYRRYTTMSAQGLTVSRVDYQSRDFPSWEDDFTGGFSFLPAALSRGSFSGYSFVPDSGASTPGSSWTGSASGSIQVAGSTVTTPAGTFAAVEVTQNSTASRDYGAAGTGVGTVAMTMWLVKGLGIARIQYFATETLNGTEVSRRRFDLSLTASDRLDLLAHASVTGSGLAIADGDTTPRLADGTAFGHVDAYGGTSVRTFVVTNTGTEPLKIRTGQGSGGVSLTGADAALFTVMQLPSAVIAPGGTTSFSIRFATGGQSGLKQAEVTLNSRGDDGAYTFSVQGTGDYRGSISVSGGPGAQQIEAGGTQTSTSNGTDFGSVSPGNGFTRRFIVSNSGTGALAFTDLAFGPVVILGDQGAGHNFSVTGQPAAQLGPGASVVFRVRFTPTSPGVHTATILIMNTSSNQPAFMFEITGTGV